MMPSITCSDAARAVHQVINRTSRPYPRDATVPERFEHWAARRPDAPAAVQGDRELTYAQLNRLANGLAGALHGEGVGAGTTVGVCVARSPEMLVALVGVLKCGGTYVPLDAAWPDERLRAVLADAGCPYVLSDEPDALAVRLDGSGCRIVRVDERSLESRDDNPVCPVGAEAIACINFTSGSTGRPKGVPIRHRGIVRLVHGATYAPLDEHSRVLQITPFTFDIATWEIWSALLLGGVSVLYPAEAPRLSVIDRVVKTGRASATLLTTALFNAIVDEAPEALETMATITTGGEAASPRHMARALATYGRGRLVHLYGPTECTCIGTYHPVDELPSADEPVPIGRPIQNTRLYVLADDLTRLCEPGERGELCLAGDGLAAGYLNLPDLTSERFVEREIDGMHERLYRTGDWGYLRPDGAAVFEGRRDDQVKVNGFRIELGEITHHLNRHPAVKQSLVTVRGGRGDRSLVAFVVPVGPATDTDVLRRHLAAKVPGYMVPAQFHYCESFPLTPNGKIDFRALLASHYTSDTSGALTS
jgi:amino acid adenylation domain-containing protein